MTPKLSLFLGDRGWQTTFVTAFFVLLILTAWAATDASFGMAIWKIRVVTGLEPVEIAGPQGQDILGLKTIRWDALGKRAIAYSVLVVAGTVATLACCYLTVRHATRLRIACCLGLLSSWGVLSSALDTIQERRTRRQVERILPKVEQAANALHQHWPVQSGEIPPGIKFYLSPETRPDVLLLQGPHDLYPFHEDFGRRITRGQDGIIRFDLAGAPDTNIEFHPNGTQPVKHLSGFGNLSPPVATIIPLKDKWFLVWYRND